MVAASNDNGDVTWIVPTGALNFPSSVPGIQYHDWQAGVTPTTSIAHKGMVAGAKVMAASLIDLLTSPELRQKARAEFDKETTETKYFSFLPADATPPHRDSFVATDEGRFYRGLSPASVIRCITRR